MGKIRFTFSMMGASWDVLKKDKELLVFPIFSGICCLLVIASFALPMWMTGAWQRPAPDAPPLQHAAYYAILFLFYFCNYFVIIFFNSAIVACAIVRMRGGNPTISTGINASLSRLPQIVGWALVSATVGVILRIIEDRSKRAGQIIAGILGMAWTILTFFVVPIIVVERKGPIEAFKESAILLKKTWGERLIAHFGFGLIFFLLAILAIIPFILGVMAPGIVLKVLLIGIAGLYLILIGLVQATLQTIFQAAVYLYARDGKAPQGFDRNALSMAMGQK